MSTVLIMAGGTGGHIFPALAVAHELRSRGWQIVWLGAEQGLECRLIPQHGFLIETIQLKGIRKAGIKRWLTLPFMLIRSFIKTTMVLRHYRPNIVLGFGGYLTFPGGITCRIFGKPLIIHEQNSIAGLTNRLLSYIASRTLYAFPGVFAHHDGLVGNPIRAEMTSIKGPEERFRDRTGPLNILVIGGSLGAKIFNDIVPEALALIPLDKRPSIVHQAGLKHIDALIQSYQKFGVKAECCAFIDDMGARYAAADLIICRAGAITVTELTAVGLGSILVPYPHAVDDHQTSNAQFLCKAKASQLIPQVEFNAPRLAQLLSTITREECLTMARQAKQLASVDAASRVANECEALIGK